MTEQKLNSSLPQNFKEYRELLGLDANPTVLVALSGGADSVALFDMTERLCEKYGGEFYACHVNHGIRGEDAIRDRDFSVALAKDSKHCKEMLVLDADVPSLARESGRSLELEAREVRYSFFQRIMKEKGISVLATAHHADDNLETMLFNLVRGSGARGMCGIPPVRELSGGGVVARPMLLMSKREILDYCEERGLRFMTDATNLDNDYSRNLIRNEIIPRLESINPALRVHASNLSGDIREMMSELDREAESLDDGGDGASVKALCDAPKILAPKILADAIKRSGLECQLERTHVSAILELCRRAQNNSSTSLPNKVRARIRGDRLVFEKDERKKSPPKPSFKIQVFEGINNLPDGSRLIFTRDRAKIAEAQNIYKFATKLYLGSDKINLTAKSRESGDKIRIKGVSKSIKKLMCDTKFDIDHRDRVPLICDGDEVICVVGGAVSDGAFVKRGSNAAFIWEF